MTMHATFMVFFVLTVAPFAAFGNFFIPIHTGAEDMPFPHFNMMSFWTTFVAFCVMLLSFFVGDGPTLGGWTQYAPLSAVGTVAGPGQGAGVVIWATSIAIFCVGQLFGSLNFIPNILDLRCKGLSMWRLPLPTWAWFITSCMGLTSFSVLMPACILLILDHVAGTSFFVASNLVINDQIAAALRWIDSSMAAPVLVLRTSRGVYRHRARDGHRIACSHHQHAQADAEPSRDGLLHGRLGRSQLHGVRTPHVCQRDESGLVVAVLVPHADDYDPIHHHCLDLDWEPLRCEVAH